MNKPLKKYYRVEFTLTSPLAVGSGENAETDKDIAMDSRGVPYIPGSAMAGVYRGLLPQAEAERYFGKLLSGTREIDESRVIVYDAVLRENSYLSKRDMVALDEYKTAMAGAKFDFQILETGAAFTTWIEENLDADDDGIAEKLLGQWQKQGLRIGAKTRRGYGSVQLEHVYRASFALPADADRWLDFEMYRSGDACWKEMDIESLPTDQDTRAVLHLELELRQQGGISIREYSTRVREADYEQMRLHKLGVPVIPGTSWAGAFRAQLRTLGLSDAELRAYFGYQSGEGKGQRSRISFSESRIEGGSDVTYSRNAIDRFTGGTIDGALYKEKTYYNGRTKLEITIELSAGDPIRFLDALAAAVMDLHNGYLAVGGLTAIGRGLFAISSIRVNGETIETIDYRSIAAALKEHAAAM